MIANQDCAIPNFRHYIVEICLWGIRPEKTLIGKWSVLIRLRSIFSLQETMGVNLSRIYFCCTFQKIWRFHLLYAGGCFSTLILICQSRRQISSLYTRPSIKFRWSWFAVNMHAYTQQDLLMLYLRYSTIY